MEAMYLTNKQMKLVRNAIDKSIRALKKKPQHKSLYDDYVELREKFGEDKDGEKQDNR